MFESLRLRITKRFILNLNLLLFFLLLIPFSIIFLYLENLVFQQVKKQAETIYQQIVLTKKWISQHGGIYVEKLPWVEENPQVELIAEKKQILSPEGKILIKKSPALVTKHLSQLAKENNLYWFRLTSIKYINLYNKPDITEIKALKEFERQKKEEFVKIEKIGDFTYFRLIKPLITERECLKCHVQQGYTEGTVRGAISIFIPLDETLQQLSFYKKILFLIFVLFWLILNLTVILLSNHFIFKPLYCSISLLKILRNLYGESFQDRSSPSLLQVKNEWELLFDSINKFIREINYYQERLEERVREVTKDLEEKNKMLQNLLERRKLLITNMAHELKTPLTSVKGSIDYLKRQLELKKDLFEKVDFEKFWEFFEISQKNVKRLIDLFNALIDLEKAEANLLELEITSFNLRELVEEVIEYLKGFALSKGLVFKINIREDLYLFADREKLAIVLSNLIHNAIKFSPEGGEIAISAYEREGKIRIEVEDQGKGISKEEVERLFERFYKRDFRGTGLGLAIAKAYVEAHGGKIGTIPREKGTLFYFEIPQTPSIINKCEKKDSHS